MFKPFLKAISVQAEHLYRTIQRHSWKYFQQLLSILFAGTIQSLRQDLKRLRPVRHRVSIIVHGGTAWALTEEILLPSLLHSLSHRGGKRTSARLFLPLGIRSCYKPEYSLWREVRKIPGRWHLSPLRKVKGCLIWEGVWARPMSTQGLLQALHSMTTPGSARGLAGVPEIIPRLQSKHQSTILPPSLKGYLKDTVHLTIFVKFPLIY